jgi:hypothetical protein
MATLPALAVRPDVPAPGAWRVDVSRGATNTRVSSEWFNRPDDERFLSLGELHESVHARAERAHTRIVESRAIRVEARRDCPERLSLILPDSDMPVTPTNWSFGQMCSLVGAPAGYLRDLPATLAGINIQYGLANHRGEQVKVLQTENGRSELRALTGPDYGSYLNSQPVSLTVH